jgi:alkane 1-monooxygenase
VSRSIWATVPFWIAYFLPPLIIICVYNRGVFVWVPLTVVFVALPLVDAMAGVAPLSREAPDLAFNRWFRVVTWLWVPMQVALIAWLVGTVARSRLTVHEMIIAAASVGAATGAIGMTFAHELIHRRQPYERVLGNVLLLSVTYPHFAIEHIRGHHRHVGTPEDPATARLGESLYRFLPRTVFGSVASAWRLEQTRLRYHEYRTWSSHNVMLRYAVIQTVIYAAVIGAGGAIGLALFAGQSLVAIVILEAINYVEHYGLARAKIDDGTYERVRAEHSWDAPHRVSNWLLINLPRHADHHLSAAKRYQSLELLPGAPRLPGGYGAMFLLSLVPPAWFRVMNPRVAAARSGTPI